MDELTSKMDLQLSPLRNNIAVCFCMILVYKVAIELACWTRLRWKRGTSRILLHVTLVTCSMLFWPLFDQRDWSWRLNGIVPAVMFSRMVYKGAVVRNPGDADVQNLTLSGSPGDLLFGPSFLALIMLYLGNYEFMQVESAIIAAACLGDSLAPFIGRYGRHIYRMPLSNTKTMEGSVVGVFLGTVGGSYFFLYMTRMNLLPLRHILCYSAISAVAEGTAPSNLDNLMIAISIHFSFETVQNLLPA